MTTTILPPKKVCLGCGRRFPKPGKLTRAEWDARRYCSAACGNSAKIGRKMPPRAPRPVEPLPTLSDQPWTSRAACADHPDVEVVATDSTSIGKRPKAWMWPILRLCDRCPVTAECLAYGQATKSDGVWGGVLLERGKRVVAAGNARAADRFGAGPVRVSPSAPAPDE